MQLHLVLQLAALAVVACSIPRMCAEVRAWQARPDCVRGVPCVLALRLHLDVLRHQLHCCCRTEPTRVRWVDSALWSSFQPLFCMLQLHQLGCFPLALQGIGITLLPSTPGPTPSISAILSPLSSLS